MMDEVEQIKERLDIVEIISSYLTLKKAGVNLKANCPFHHEKTPSFMVSPERQTFKCFGCGEGGDMFTFIEKIEGVDFYNALKILADKAGVTLQSRSIKHNDREFKSDKKTKIFEINDWTKKLYHKILLDHPKAKKARDYVLQKRKLKKETVQEFEIGYAPDSWDLLIKFLKNKGYSVEEMFLSGVVVRNERGDYYDRFRGRIIFPINNVMGNTVGFTSRIIDSDKTNAGAKYINSSESPIYIKGKTIYGLDKAKLAIKEAGLAVMVEGNMDVIACHQAGFNNVVATSGTALTDEQLKILSRYTTDVAFSFDSDEAGIAAMKKAIILALENDINSKIISTIYKDPDEAITADPKNWSRAVEAARPSLEYWIDLLIKKDPTLSIATKKKIAKEILPVIKNIYSPIEKEYYIKYLSTKLSVSENSLLGVLEKTPEPKGKNDQSEVPDAKISTEEKLLGLLWSKPELITKYKDKLSGLKINLPKFKKFINSGFEKENVAEEESLALDQLSMIALRDFDSKEENGLSEEIEFIIGRLKLDNKDKIKEEFAEKIQAAEQTGDKEKVRKLLEEFSSLIK